MVTFLISGIWHGANWPYVAWGGMNGLLQIAEDMLAKPVKYINEKLKVKTESFSYKLGQVLRTDFLFVLCVTVFRSESMKAAGDYLRRMFTYFNPWVLSDGSLYELGLNYTEMHILWLSVLILFAVGVLRYKKRITLSRWLEKQTLWFQWAAAYGLIFANLIYGMYGINFDTAQFIYFQF